MSRMLTILRLGDAGDLEKALPECKNIEVRKSHASMGLIFFDSALRHRRPIYCRISQMCEKDHVESGRSLFEVDSGGSDMTRIDDMCTWLQVRIALRKQ